MATMMYTPFYLGKKQISNRLVASAMFEYGADKGKITEKIKGRYVELADGGSGLIITGMHAVSASAAVAPVMVNTRCDGYVEDLAEIAQAVHGRGGTILVQLQHCGDKTYSGEGYDRLAVCDKKVSAAEHITKRQKKKFKQWLPILRLLPCGVNKPVSTESRFTAPMAF